MKQPVSTPPHSGSPILSWLLPAGAVMLSCLFFTQLNDPNLLPRELGWSLIMAAFVGVGLLGKRARIHFSIVPPVLGKWIMGCLFALIAAHLVSLIIAGNPNEALVAVIHLLILASTFWVVAWQWEMDGWEGIQKWVGAIALIAAIQAILGLLQSAGWVEGVLSRGWKQPTGTQANPNLYGELLTLAMPFSILWTMGLRGRWRWFAAAFLLGEGAMIYASGSRASLLVGLIWAIALLPLLPKWLARLFPSVAKPMGWGIGGLGLVMAFGLLYMGWGRKEMPQSYAPLFHSEMRIEPHMSTAEVRMVLWNRSFQMVKDHPFTGIGAGNWKSMIPAFGIKADDSQGRYGQVYFLRPHNEYLGVAAETGWLGLLAFLGIIAGGLIRAIMAIRKPLTVEEEKREVVGMLVILAFGVFAFFSFPSERILPWVLFSVAVVMVGSVFRPQSGRGNRFLGIVLGLFMVSIVVLIGGRIGQDRSIARMRVAFDRKQWPTVMELARKSEGWFTLLEPQTGIPLAWHQGVSLLSQGQMKEGLVQMERAYQISPNHLAVRTNLGSAYAMNSQLENAVDVLSSLVHDFPDHYEARVNLAIVLAQLQHFEQAKEVFSPVPDQFSHPQLANLRALLQQNN